MPPFDSPGWTRRHVLGLCGAGLIARGAPAQTAVPEDAQRLRIVSWGGAYAEAQQRALFAPYQQQTGVTIELLEYDGSLAALQDRAGPEQWDLVDMTRSGAIDACEQGLLHPLNPVEVILGYQGHGSSDFVDATLDRCWLAQSAFATVLAYANSAFPGLKPQRIDDLFDLTRFPGRRALPRDPYALLEWALISEGAPISQVYDLLSTKRGMRLAFRRLESLREHIIWYEDLDAGAEHLRDGSASMAVGFNGRFFAAAHRQTRRVPLTIVWDGQLIEHSGWAIPRQSESAALAQSFIRYATSARRMARLAEHIPYAPARRSAMQYVGNHYRHAIPMRDHLPNSPLRRERTIVADSLWHAHTQRLRQRRFQQWLDQAAD